MKEQIDIAPERSIERPARARFYRIAALGLVAVLAVGCTATPAAARAYVYVGTPVYVYRPPVVYAPRPVYVAPAPAPIYAAPVPTCHQYQTNVAVGGAARQVTGTACLQPDGSWHIVN